MELVVDDSHTLTPMKLSDMDSLVEHLSNANDFMYSLSIPFPYTSKHAEDFIKLVLKEQADSGEWTRFAIRLTKNGKLMGVVSLLRGLAPYRKHTAELSYWLAKLARSGGLMTRSASAVIRYAFEELGFVRVFARANIENIPSQRVLEKVGMEKECLSKKEACKDGVYIDAFAYAIINPSYSQ